MEKKYFNGHDEINRFFCFHSKNYQTLLIILNLIQIQQPAAAAAVVFISFFLMTKAMSQTRVKIHFVSNHHRTQNMFDEQKERENKQY